MKLLSSPLYALGVAASFLVRRRESRWAFGCGSGLGEGALELYGVARAADPTLRLVWLVRDKDELDSARQLGLTPVLRSSWKGFRATLNARVLVVTHGLGDVNRFGTHGAFIVQLWHGIPLKKIQLDSPVTFGGPRILRGILRALYRKNTSRIGVVPAASDTSADRLRTAFGLPAERVVVTGDPRDDVVFGDRDAAHELLARSLGELPDGEIILYAPTWRDGDADPAVPTRAEWMAIAEYLESASSVLVLRPHPHSVGDYSPGPTASPRIRMLPSSMQNDINPVLPAVEALITDYSSIAFDFALLGRPIVFLAPDAEEYARTRGLYEPFRDFSGGSEVSTWAGVLGLLNDPDAMTRLSAHAVHLADVHHRYRDGRNTSRVYDELRTRLGGQE
ncbi:MAG: CDP-glycerol glycerophosphotransferase family protein [Terrimesophilobacter sp.]